jgi:HAD superfamily hydrolase (TIGR01549 family)
VRIATRPPAGLQAQSVIQIPICAIVNGYWSARQQRRDNPVLRLFSFGQFEMQRPKTSFLFDLDGTLVDSVYQHVLSWREALEAEGIQLSVWRIHRKIGMSGGLLTNMLLRETGIEIEPKRIERLRQLHAAAYIRRSAEIQPLPGAHELLAYLTEAEIPWAVATSGRMETARPALEALRVDFERIPVITRDQVKYAKPDPDLFLTAAERLGTEIQTASVVGDSVWDMLAARRAPALGIGLLSGGYGQEELERAGAYRVYEDPADLLKHIDEVGGRR